MITSNRRTSLSAGIRVTEEGKILYSWRRWIGLAMIMGSLLGFIPFFSDPNFLSDIFSPPFTLFELIPFAIFFPIFAFAYWGLGWIINRTELFIEHDTLLVRIRPLPWMGNTSIPIYEIAEVRVVEKWEMEGYADKAIRVYSLNVLKKSGTTIKIISSIRDIEQTAVLKQELQKLLGISEPNLLSRIS